MREHLNINPKPFFSLLLANYNNSQFISECLDSVYRQSYTNWEIIFVDDCSKDNSLEIINRHAVNDKRIIVTSNEQNKGCGFTKAKCVQLASGDFCGFLDTDDALMPNAIEIMVNKHIEYPNAALVYSRRFHCNSKLKIKNISNDDTNKFISQLATPLVNHFATFKKYLYDQTSGIDTYMKRAVDQDLYLKLEEKGNVVFIPEVLYLYRHNNNSISLNTNEYKAQAWHIYANGNACKRRDLSLDDYCSIIKPGKFISFMLKFLKAVRRINYTIKKVILPRENQ